MENVEIAENFHELGFFTELEDDANASFKARAYHRAADVIAGLSSDIQDIYRKEGLNGLIEIPSVGKAIASKIEECIMTGRIKHLEELKLKIPIAINELSEIEGIGPKTIKLLYAKLQIKNLADLEKAALEGSLRNVPGFTVKKEHAIVQRIQFIKKGKDRYLIGEVYPLVKEIESRLSQIAGVKKAIIAGSVRRMKETIRDIDYLVISKDTKKVMEYFVTMPEVQTVSSRGSNKASVQLKNGMDADLLVVPEESFGSAIQYFTGSKEHVVEIRKIAVAKDLHLNEWGVFDKERKRVAGATEEEVYRILGLDWIPPEMRENKGEVELAKNSKLQKLIEYGSLKGDLQVHSNNTDGTKSIEEMALAAREKFELDYIAITDHTKSLTVAHGLDEEKLLEQADKIATLNDELDDFRILSSAEVNIMKDGSLDISNNVLDKLDIVGASVHSNFTLPIEAQTERLVKAARNPSVDILFHPTGRLINRREAYPIDIKKVISVAKDTNTVIEIDAHYNRLDLNDDYVKMAVQNKVKLVIDSDAHHPVHYSFLMFGIGQARRGWAEKSDILNTLPVDELLKSLK
ncbi:MAG: DNA polymerase/3'-5' exonuclease PolX [Nitrososphaerales archaeon]